MLIVCRHGVHCDWVRRRVSRASQMENSLQCPDVHSPVSVGPALRHRGTQ